MSALFNRLWLSFRDKDYRQVYVEGWSDSKIATQIKVLREQRGWTQQQLAETAGMKQSRIAALEDVNYSSWSIRTLRRLAQALDLWLDVELKEFGAVWPQLRDFRRDALTRRSFADDPVFKEREVEQKVNLAIVSSTISQAQSLEVSESALSSVRQGQQSEPQSLAGQQKLPSMLLALVVTKPSREGSAARQVVARNRKHHEAQNPSGSRGARAGIA